MKPHFHNPYPTSGNNKYLLLIMIEFRWDWKILDYWGILNCLLMPKKVKVKSLSHVWLLATPRTVACQTESAMKKLAVSMFCLNAAFFWVGQSTWSTIREARPRVFWESERQALATSPNGGSRKWGRGSKEEMERAEITRHFHIPIKLPQQDWVSWSFLPWRS